MHSATDAEIAARIARDTKQSNTGKLPGNNPVPAHEELDELLEKMGAALEEE